MEYSSGIIQKDIFYKNLKNYKHKYGNNCNYTRSFYIINLIVNKSAFALKNQGRKDKYSRTKLTI